MRVRAIITINGERKKGVLFTFGDAAYLEDEDGVHISWDDITDIDTKLEMYSWRGKISGSVISDRKKVASRENGKRGGRPKKVRDF